MGTSTFSQYTVVADVSVVAVNPKAPLEKVCLLGCGITTAWGAVVKQPGISRPFTLLLLDQLLNSSLSEGSTVAVFGCGAIGLGVINTSALVGASRVLAIDTNPGKETWAKKFGATDFINPISLKEGQRIQDYLIEITDGGLDYTFDCTGNVRLGFYSKLCPHLNNRASGSCHAICFRSLPQRLGSIYCNWCGCCRPRNFNSAVSRHFISLKMATH